MKASSMSAANRAGSGIWRRLFGEGKSGPAAVVHDPVPDFDEKAKARPDMARNLTAAFLIRLAGPGHRQASAAAGLLERHLKDPAWGTAAGLFLDALEFVPGDIAREAVLDSGFAGALRRLEEALAGGYSPDLQERLWAVFFPEGTGIRGREGERVGELRRKRLVRITATNPDPLKDPVREILFTSNALLAPPPAGTDLAMLRLDPIVRRELPRIMAEPQLHWYDHPIPVGTPTGQNEALYGLRHLDEALAWEIRKGHAPEGARAACVLSVSVTHHGLNRIARTYLESELALAGGLKHIDLYVFTEEDVRRLLEGALLPLAGSRPDALADVFGVDGPYGRHYSFLKAVAVLWQAFVDPDVRAVFKIDLDQVFPQADLEREAGGSMADLLRTALWGARGTDADGAPVELDMIAGSLVNERDIGCGLFTPDITCPAATEPAPAERLFWSRLPQALSTEAEMTARYDSPPLDGRTGCLQRVHVTGGANGILVNALRRHRPFTPSFVGRAEDQAYLMSAFGHDPGLGYVHCPGLVMRHDKESFAVEAVRAARAGKALGDIVRILQFSAYARALGGVGALKRRFDPFTGCFISRVPRALAMLRFALEALTMFQADGAAAGVEFVSSGARRLRDELAFADPSSGALERRLAHEREGWDAYFDGMGAADSKSSDPFRAAIVEIVRGCRIRT